jgi:hypothetical protein
MHLILFLAAQALPGIGLFGGYSYLRAPDEPAGPVAANLNGWNAAVKLNFRPRVGWLFDGGGQYGRRRTGESGEGAYRQHALLFGPEVRLFTARRFTTHFRALIGAVWVDSLTLPRNSPPPAAITLGPSKPLAGALGGSLDYRLSARISLRLIQPDLIVASLGSQNLKSIRLSAGVVLDLGGS